MTLLAVNELTVHYGVIQALDKVKFRIDEGEIVTLLGANGAGKTTALRAISGMIPKSTGTVYFNEQDITKKAAHQVTGLGISHVPEGRRVFAGLSVEDNLRLGAYLRKDRVAVNQDLEKVYSIFPRLKERRKQPSGSLSGGEQQMLAMGRGLMSKPKLLLLDEPSMGLAPLLVKEIFSIIEEINESGTTILLVEQNAHLSLKISDRTYVLETGSVVLEGASEELSKNQRVQQAYLGA